MTKEIARQSFQQSWEEQQDRVYSQLPDDIDPKKFKAVVFRAVQEDPELLIVDDKMSLFLAAQRAAQDGLIPDKREGALVVFRRKTREGNYVSGVQWMPMIGGIRKRLAALGFDIRARVVHENDQFDQDEGDDEKIVHKPAPLDKPRGDIIGVYAIATDAYTGNVYRETMRLEDIEKVRACAKTQHVWNAWYGEKARVAVCKRLAKSLPLNAQGDKEKEKAAELFHAMIDRDNSDFDPSGVPAASDKAESVQRAARKEPGSVRKLERPKKETKPDEWNSLFYQKPEPEPEEAVLPVDVDEDQPPLDEEFQGKDVPF